LGVAQFIVDPANSADWGDFSLWMAVIGALHTVGVWGLLRRKAIALRLLAISSTILFIMYGMALAPPPEYAGAGQIGRAWNIPPLVVLTASLWGALSCRGRLALRRHLEADQD